MKKTELKLRKLLRTIFGSISLTAVAFTFQACYGPGGDPFYDIRLSGTVVSKATHRPIKGIKVVANDEQFNYGFTDKNGKFDFYTQVPDRNFYMYMDTITTFYSPDSVRVYFLDSDGIENGSFVDKTFIIAPAHKDEVKINVELDTKH